MVGKRRGGLRPAIKRAIPIIAQIAHATSGDKIFTMTTASSRRTVRASLEEYGRGVAGGLLFSLPLLYTMEVWWSGFITHPARLLLYVASTFILLLAYNRYAGLREDAGFLEVVIDSVEELGLGIVLSAFILWLLGRINPAMPLIEIMGQIVIEAMTVAIGISVGTAQLGADSDAENNSGKKDEEDKKEEEPDFLQQVVIAVCGAILIAANVGPTEEIVVLAAESTSLKLLALALFSLLISVLILNFSGFRGSNRFISGRGAPEIFRGAITTYAVALAASAAICWFFGRFDGASPEMIIGQTVVLGFPATLGASAGRLLLQSNSQ